MSLSSNLVVCFAICTGIVFQITNGDKTSCVSGAERCDGKCIPKLWFCDGDQDCSDNSDEENCQAPTCAVYQHTCPNSRCIPKNFVCDGENDCLDNSDETDCGTDPLRCKPEMEKCDNGQCIPMKWFCDGQADCTDRSDEKNCRKDQLCRDNQYMCGTGQCIQNYWVCDGENDCSDNSDEKNCRQKTCRSNEYKCDNGQCIAQKWLCDRDFDCSDRSDENNCQVLPTCRSDERACDTGECLRMSWWCDGDSDCSDGSDEKDCDRTTNISTTTDTISTMTFSNASETTTDTSGDVSSKEMIPIDVANSTDNQLTLAKEGITTPSSTQILNTTELHGSTLITEGQSKTQVDNLTNNKQKSTLLRLIMT